MWQLRTLSTPLVCLLLLWLPIKVESYNLWKDNTDLLYGKKFSQKADEFFKFAIDGIAIHDQMVKL